MSRAVAVLDRLYRFFSFSGALALLAFGPLGVPRFASAESPASLSLASNEYSVILPANGQSKKPTSRLLNTETSPLVQPMNLVSLGTNSPETVPAAKVLSHVELRGWDHLYNLLVDEGVDAKTALEVLSDSRMPEYEPLIFSLQPREPRSLYRKHNSKAAQRNALGFYHSNEPAFLDAETRFQVPKTLILALLQVETGCGANTGHDRIFYRLARLAAAASTENIQENFLRKKRSVKLLSLDDVSKRAEILEGLFLKHTAATFALAEKLSIHPLEIRGSSAGAIGLPQFLPGNVTSFGVDGNGDGEVNVHQATDAIYSVGNFLRSFGWTNQRKLSEKEKFDILSNYNRSEPYISTVLALQSALELALLRDSSSTVVSESKRSQKAKLLKCADKKGIKACT